MIGKNNPVENKQIIPQIISPSDLFGLEIFPENKFESEYGILTLSPVIIPDFSNDEKGFIRLKEEFDYFKSFLSETDLMKKLEIAKQINNNEFSVVGPDGFVKISNYASRSSNAFSHFVELLEASTKARIFESKSGHSTLFDICYEFGYGMSACLSSGNVKYNGIPIVQPLACAGGMYLYCLGCGLKDKYCIYQNFLDKILKNGFPTHNYLSWAFSQASKDEEIISFVSEVHILLDFFLDE